MGTENPSRSNYPLRPATPPFVSPQSTPPFLSSGPVVGSTTSSPFSTSPFSSGPLVGSEAPAFRPSPPGRSNEPVRPPPSSSSSSSYGPPHAGSQHFTNPPGPSTGQVLAPRMGPPISTPLARPAAGPVASPPVSLPSQPLRPSIPMGSPPPSIKTGQSNANIPSPANQLLPASMPNIQPSPTPIGPSYAPARATSQPAFPGYANTQQNTVVQAPPLQSAPFPLQQGAYAPPGPPTPFLAQQRSYGPDPSSLYSGTQMQYHGMAPPTATSQGLAEDFSSLSLGSVPGSFDAGLNATALPRPLDGDVEPKTFVEMYPMNCSPRVLRLTTSGLPNSQSLASRWHLPLGAVVCPLAEAPTGEEVPIVNFSTTGIIRCKRCRTYVNPYVTFTDHGRKWRCNICSLLNDVPGDYFAHVDASGRRADLEQRTQHYPS